MNLILLKEFLVECTALSFALIPLRLWPRQLSIRIALSKEQNPSPRIIL
jgi:hypothetical protein